MHYDYLIVGSGLFGATFAYRAKQAGKSCLVIDKRPHLCGNVYCEKTEGINVHKYGAHIFHTNNKEVWDFVNALVPFNRYTNSPVANYHGKLYNLPFNMNTFAQLWGVRTPDEAKAKIEEQRVEALAALQGREPQNLEEQALCLVGKDIFHKLIKEYTEKQWGRDCKNLPPFIIKRLPVRYCYNNNYFNDCYQGIPIGGYNKMIEKLLEGVDLRLNVNYNDHREEYNALAKKIVYTGPIDEFFDFKYGPLEYRSLRFEEELLDQESFQGNIAVNYTDHDHPYTRIVEHKYFEFGTQPKTVITKEYSQEWKPGMEPYYPVNDAKNSERYAQYKAEADKLDDVLFYGRLAEYKYYDMHQIVENVISNFEL